jgi:exopolyphosphatase/pppGpp-phosphohydrolase
VVEPPPAIEQPVEPAVAQVTEPAEPALEPVFEPTAPLLGPGALAVAGVDVGANSVHLLVAVVTGHRLEPIVDESVFLGLGDQVETRGTLGPSKRAELVAALVRYAETARRLGAGRIAFVGTDPLRRAADAATAVHEVGLASGVALSVIDPREEAELTLLGVSLGRPIERELAIVDVGGGSSQLVRIGPGHAQVSLGLRLGGARLTAAFVSHDPPTPAEIEAMREEARRVVGATPAVVLSELVAVGGTASNLVKVLPGAMLDRRLDLERLAAALAVLGSEPAELAAQRHAINPTRARLLPAGAVILEAILAHFGLAGLSVSEAGVREGLVLALARAGVAWRDQLATLARGWDDPAD